MKHKLLFGIMALVIGVFMAGCSDDEDYTGSKTPLLTDESVLTGSADVTATGATLHGTVKGLENQSESSYTVGFNYGYAEDALTQSVKGASGSAFDATVSGMPNDVIYYQAFVTLQGKVTYTGKVQQCVLTNTRATTGEPKDLTANTATLSGKLADFPDNSNGGVILSSVGGDDTQENIDLVRSGVRIATPAPGADFDVTALGLVPGTTYYYCAYLDLGSGVVYGDVKSFTTPKLTDYNVDVEFVDLGLSVKWAKCNIGAVKESDLGGRFGFGDIAGYKTSINTEDYAKANIYKTTSDVAYWATKGVGMMPTADEFEELCRGCDQQEETTDDGVKGVRFTSKVNGNSIFIPYAGSRIDNTVSGEGTTANLWTGSINLNNSGYGYYYQIGSSLNGRTTAPTYTAMSVRAVSTAKNVPFDKTKLYQKWYLDNGQDGKQHVFEGPFTQWGAKDTYGTVTNNEPYIGAGIQRGIKIDLFGNTKGKDYGYMQFNEDGTYLVHRIAEDGTVTDEQGTFIVDDIAKTITLDKDVIAGNTTLPQKSGTLNILSLNDNQLQIALPKGDGQYAYSANYYSEAKRLADEEITVNMICVGSDWAGTWGTAVGNIAPAQLEGQHTFTYHGSCNGAMIVTLDFNDLLNRYPNAMVRIDDIKCDGQSIKFDANKFFYGDIEGKGNYRIELFNIYGKGSTPDNKYKESPFSTLTNAGSDPAFKFSEKLEITYTVITDLKTAYKPLFVTINPSWGGPWDYNSGQAFEIKLVDNKYVVEPNSFDVKYESTDHAAGSIMTFVQVDDLYKYFPGTHSTLDELLLDGKSVSYDKSKVIDAVDSGTKYRLELWNCYAATKEQGNAFGIPDGDVLKELGFSKSIEVKYTINSLFKTPEW